MTIRDLKDYLNTLGPEWDNTYVVTFDEEADSFDDAVPAIIKVIRNEYGTMYRDDYWNSRRPGDRIRVLNMTAL